LNAIFYSRVKASTEDLFDRVLYVNAFLFDSWITYNIIWLVKKLTRNFVRDTSVHEAHSYSTTPTSWNYFRISWKLFTKHNINSWKCGTLIQIIIILILFNTAKMIYNYMHNHFKNTILQLYMVKALTYKTRSKRSSLSVLEFTDSDYLPLVSLHLSYWPRILFFSYRRNISSDDKSL
jgi:hypothetical protein